MADRVVEQVPHDLPNAPRIELDGRTHMHAGPDRAPTAGRQPREGRRLACNEIPDVHRLARERGPVPVRPGKHEEVFGEPHQLLGLLLRTGQRLEQLRLGAGPSERELELRLQVRERGAQLMTGIGDEPTFSVDGGADSVEHVVEGLRQPRELVPGFRNGQSAAEVVGRDRGGPRPHDVHGAQGEAGHDPAHPGRERDRGGASDGEHQGESGERLATVLQRRAHHDDGALVERHREQPRGHAIVRRAHGRREEAGPPQTGKGARREHGSILQPRARSR